jgi:hypothetical protein
MSVCFLSERATKKIRKFPVRGDIVDASCYLDGAVTAVPVFVSVRLVNRLKRLGTEAGIEKLKKVVNRGVMVLRHNNGNKKSNFIVDLVPSEFYVIERYYGEQQPGLIIDCEALQATEPLRANG